MSVKHTQKRRIIVDVYSQESSYFTDIKGTIMKVKCI